MLAEETQHLPRDEAVLLMQALDNLDRYLERQALALGQQPLVESTHISEEVAQGAELARPKQAQRLTVPGDELSAGDIRLVLAVGRLIDTGTCVLPLRLTSFGLHPNEGVLQKLQEDVTSGGEQLIAGTSDLVVPVGTQTVVIRDVTVTHHVRIQEIETSEDGDADGSIVVHVVALSGAKAVLSDEGATRGDPD